MTARPRKRPAAAARDMTACSDIADLDALLTGLRRGGAEGTSTGLVLRGVPGLSEADLVRPASDQPLAASA
jgi:hypothetical protein